MKEYKSIACDYGKTWHNHDCEYEWKGRHCYKCDSNENLVNLTNSSWWNFYYKCDSCGQVYQLSYGDKMGGQSDAVYFSDMGEVTEAISTYPDWYKIKEK